MKQKALALFVLIAGRVASAALGAQELSIDYSYNMARPDNGNHLSFRSPNWLIASDKDAFDAAAGASMKKTTALFGGAVCVDMAGRNAFPQGLRGVLLFPLASQETRTEDNFHAAKSASGEITLEYVHRGVAYRIVTTRKGAVTLPRGRFQARTIGYIEGHDPQVISRDFAPNGDAASVEWRKVWDSSAPSGRAVSPGSAALTGPIENDYGSFLAMFNWDGSLAVALEGDVLTIKGTLKLAKR